MTAPRVWEAGRVAAEAKRVVLTTSGRRGKVPVPGGLTYQPRVWIFRPRARGVVEGFFFSRWRTSQSDVWGRSF